MKRLSIYRLLEIPIVYLLAQKILAPGSETMLKKHFKNVFSGSKGLVLDLGCGPELNTPPLENGVIVGIDINSIYVQKYIGTNSPFRKQGGSNCRILGLTCSSERLPFDNNVFDEVRSFGLFHHLSLKSATETIKEMFRCTRPGGKVRIIDTPWPEKPFFRPLAWFINRLDRGKWIRTAQEWMDLAMTAYPGDWATQRFTYTYTGIEAVVMQINKKDA